ncbi:MAG: MarC family protein [Burkholderiaceae bacterium]
MDFVKTFLSLLALVNPLGALPFFISLTSQDSDRERRRIVRVASLAVILVICFSALVGEKFIGFFGVSVEAFEVGGGVIMLLMAVSMMNAQQSATKHTPEESIEAEAKQSIAVVPLAVPLLTGPGTISTVIVYAGKVTVWWEYLGLIGCGVLIGVLTYITLSLAAPLSRVLGQTGINIVTRLMGLMLAALAVEFIVGGLGDMLPALKR